MGKANERRFVHLGERLLALGRIRSGLQTVPEAAHELGVPEEAVRNWLTLHAGERVLSFSEARGEPSAQALALSRRAQRLAELIAEAERELRALHQEHLRGLVASNDELADSKKVAANSTRRR